MKNNVKSLFETSLAYEEGRRRSASLFRERWLKMSQKERAMFRKLILEKDPEDSPANRHYRLMKKYYPAG